MINITIEKNDYWKKLNQNSCIFWIKGYLHSHNYEEIFDILRNIKKNEITSFLKKVDGHFALVFHRPDLTLISVDKIRSTPIFFANINNEFYIDSNPNNLINLKGFSKIINDDAKLEISMAGFTIGNKTIYEDLYTLKAGEFVIFQNDKYERLNYYQYFDQIFTNNFEYYLTELSNITINIFKKLIKQIGKRQIIIPLSGGNDSRLIASVLRYLNVKNVKCYTYGSQGNYEAKVAQSISKKLGYEWIFIPLTYKKEKKYYQSEEFNNFLKFSETFSSVPFIQSLTSIKYLKEMNWIDDDAIFINGSTGDFISGGHISHKILNNFKITDINKRKENILNFIIEKHFSLWGYLKNERNINRLKRNLLNEFANSNINFEEPAKDHLIFEYSEYIDRQTKYIISGQRVYEYYGYDWRLPLWDDEYLNFWKKVPLEFKVNQKLYLKMLMYNNFHGVWNDSFSVNRNKIVPVWIIPLRFLFKFFFVFFGNRGKKAWRQFDINIFHYFMSIPHTWDMYSYLRVVKDILKKPRNAVSWASENYLTKFNKQ